jgi:hypothetical protein
MDSSSRHRGVPEMTAEQAWTARKKKGPLVLHKRPKSREETPKEGSGNASRYRTATICGRAAQNARTFGLTFHAKFAGVAERQHLRHANNLYFSFK